MKRSKSLTLIGFMALSSVCGCGADAGNGPEAADDGALDREGTRSRSGQLDIGTDGPSDHVVIPRLGRCEGACLRADGPRPEYLPIKQAAVSGARTVDTNCTVAGEVDTTVFVSPKGDDDEPGTQGAPVLTLARALRLAAERGHSVYVCE